MAKISNPSLYRHLAQAMTGLETDLGEFDPAEVLQTALRHGVDLLLYQQLRAGSVSGLPDPETGTLKSQMFAAVAADLILNEATQGFVDRLASHDIPVLLLKGTPVAHLHYPESFLRRRCDTDVLIRQQDIDAVARVLGEAGYVLSGLGERKQASRQFLAALPMGSGHHAHFDIHWKLSNRVLFRNSLQFENCLAEAQPVPALGPHARSLSNIDLLLHACIHRIAHGRNTERDRLLWLYDIHLLIEAMGEEERGNFKTRALEKQLGTLCADALRVATGLFGGSTAQGYLEELERNRGTEPTAKLLHASKLGWAWGDMAALGSLREKAAFARELLFR